MPPPLKCPIDYQNVIWNGQKSTGALLLRQKCHREGSDRWTNDMLSKLSRVLNVTFDELMAYAYEWDTKKIRQIWNRDTYWPTVYGGHFTNLWNGYIHLKQSVLESDPLYDPLYYIEKARDYQRTIKGDIHPDPT